MQIVLVVQQDPQDSAFARPGERSQVMAREVRSYNLYLEIPTGSFARFFDYLDGFISRELPSCRRDGKVIFTAHAVSWDPVLRLKEWADAWLTQKSSV